ncbi:DNA repair protein RecO [Fontisphaera persica]|uniref:DNA repair protein RecO n=1 Tax=Fontisphaera persica TaxID=2974023 RepID=UPI0024BF75A6|nr:DNA repair protein RecO [Fontisphaera persica]WCJ59523.1 DNA repair protein RecO [Fontisphaera persica]
MEERAHGIVLRSYPLTETSLIVHWLTSEAGHLATVAKGARRPKSPFRGKLDLFFKARFSFARSRRSDLHHLREVEVQETHPALRQNYALLTQAVYAAALLERLIERDTPVPELFDLLESLLLALPQHPPAAHTMAAWELKLLAALGLGPDWHTASLSAGTRALLQHCLALPWEQLPRLNFSPAQTQEAGRFLLRQLEATGLRPPPQRAKAWAAAED